MDLRRRLNTIEGLSRISRGLRIINSYYMAAVRRDFEQMETYEEAVRDSVGSVLGILPLELVQASRFVTTPSTAPRVFLVFYSDSGLCGNYNELVSEGLVSMKPSQTDKVYGIGTLAPDKLSQLGVKPVDYIGGLYQSKNTPLLVDYLLGITEEVFSELWLIFVRASPGRDAEYVSQRISPIDLKIEARQGELIGEPEDIIDQVLSSYLTAEMLRAFYTAAFSEFYMRWSSMQHAEDKAKELAGSVRLEITRTRQERITRELQDIIGGMNYGG
jgi:F-type H+-transporting ATPase subunit gamma